MDVPQVVERVLGEGTFSVEKFVESFGVLVEAAGGPKKLRELAIEFATKGLLLGTTNKAEWKSVALADVVVDFQNGISKRRGDSGSPVTVLRLADIDAGVRIRSENFREITLTKTEQEKYRVHAGDILVIRVNGSGDLVGRFVPCEVDRNWAYSDHLIRMRLRSDLVDTRFLCAVSRSASARLHADSKTVSTAGQKTINQTGLGSLPLSLPPLAEQKRIVARVDQLMALIDQLEAKQNRKRDLGARFTEASLEALTTAESPQEFTTAWARIQQNWPTLLDHPDKVDEIRKAMLELATRGQLVPSNSGDESVDAQLSRIRQAQSKLGSKINEGASTIDVVPHEIPTHWRWVRWGELVLGTSAGWSPQCEAYPRSDGQWGVLKVSAVSWTVFQADENKALPKSIDPRKEFAVKIADFLMSRANTAELVGRSVIVTSEPIRLLMSDKIVRCEFSMDVEQQYVNLFNRTSVARNHYVANASGTSDSMKNISRQVILSMPVPLPPLAEQKRIVAKVEHLMKLCDALEAALRRSEDRAAKLAQAVVQEMVA